MTLHNFNKVLEPSPFDAQLRAQMQTENWAGWNGYLTPRIADTLASEYFAVRSACSVLDLTPMEKYRITGPDAGAFLNRLVTRDIAKLKVGRVGYAIWCNDEGKVIDDGTIFHLGDNDYRLCAQHHQLDWLLISSIGFDVAIAKETHDIAALSVQGPTSYSVLSQAGIAGLDDLKPFGIRHTTLNGFDITVSRTGFTGDLGYELWTDPENATKMWDAIFAVKDRGLYDVRLIGLDALEMVRVEAGFLMPGWDFNTAETTVRADHDRSPFELGLDWTVTFDKPNFTGKRALMAERQRPAKRKLLKLVLEGNKPPVGSFIFKGKKGSQTGAVMAQIWSPVLKRCLAIADIDFKSGQQPQNLWAEIYYQKELKWHVKWAKCDVVNGPFWSNPRRTATPPGRF
ncbi:MAG: aminomethyltransferase family protein [Pseudomonadota bacterium]